MSVAGIKGVSGDNHGLIRTENQFFMGGHPAGPNPPRRKTLKMITLL
jgi:hypothetical protein